MADHASEFEQFMAGISGTATTVPVSATPCLMESPEPKEEPKPEPKPLTIGDTVTFVPSTPTEVVETPKPERTYRTDDGKQQIDSCGLKADTTIYSRGYAQLKFSRSWQKIGLYLADIEDLARWMQDPEGYAKWLENAKAHGLK